MLARMFRPMSLMGKTMKPLVQFRLFSSGEGEQPQYRPIDPRVPRFMEDRLRFVDFGDVSEQKLAEMFG